jgi:hypothetical protein
MTLPSPIISANKIVISKEYFTKQKLSAFLECNSKHVHSSPWNI